MDSFGFTIIALALVSFALLSKRLETTSFTPPMVFVVFGFVVGTQGLGLIDFQIDREGIHLLAELTLVLILFTDASRIDLRILIRDHSIPIRLLTIGLPLTIGFGILAAYPLFPAFSFWELALLAAILAPTDAALGQAVVSSPKIPLRISQALNVESGLNDGMTFPLVLLFAACASAMSFAGGEQSLVGLFVVPVVVAVLAGWAVGFVGGKLVDKATVTGWMTTAFQGISALGLAIIAFALSESLSGNGFIAAFVAGLTIGNTVRGMCRFLFEFAEAEGQLLVLMTFMIFGAAMAPEAISNFDWRFVAYAVLSLTAVRMIPTTLSLIGIKFNVRTIVFLGWFGPRGLASILFVLVVLSESEIAQASTIMSVTIITVLLSTFLHGFSAAPGAKWYARHAEMRADRQTCAEHESVEPLPTRFGMPGAGGDEKADS